MGHSVFEQWDRSFRRDIDKGIGALQGCQWGYFLSDDGIDSDWEILWTAQDKF